MGLLLPLLTPLSVLEKAASSILLFLEGLLDPDEGLVRLLGFALGDDC